MALYVGKRILPVYCLFGENSGKKEPEITKVVIPFHETFFLTFFISCERNCTLFKKQYSLSYLIQVSIIAQEMLAASIPGNN